MLYVPEFQNEAKTQQMDKSKIYCMFTKTILKYWWGRYNCKTL